MQVPGDIPDQRVCRQIIERAVGELGGLDILVNNAAYQMAQPGGIADINDEQFDRVMKTNLCAMFWLCREAVPHMRAGSAIINTSSIQAFQSSAELMDYASTKAAIVAFTKALAQNLALKGVRANSGSSGPDLDAIDPSHHARGEGGKLRQGRADGPRRTAGGAGTGLRVLRLTGVELRHRRDAGR
jgi:NAD(P)-dependent dehydrogenase (short-subunit alcohol dehydrogenase family)